MGIFRKLFGKKKKNEIHLTAQEAYAPPAFEPNETPAQSAEPPKEAESAVDKESIRPAAKPLSPEDRQSAKVVAYFCAGKVDEAEIMLRAALRARSVSVSEEDGEFTVNIQGGSRLKVNRALLPGVTGLPVEFVSALKSAPVHAVKLIETLNQRIEITPDASGEDFDTEYHTFIAGLCAELKCYQLLPDGSLVRSDGKLLLDSFGNCDIEPENESAPAEQTGGTASEAEQAVDAVKAQDVEALSNDENAEKGDETAAAPAEENKSNDTLLRPRLSEEEERAQRNMQLILSHGINLDCTHAVTPGKDSIYPRSVKETCERAAALMATSLVARAYTMRSGTSPAAWSASLISRYDRIYGVKLNFTAKENAYLRDPASGKHTVNVLKSEACAALMWAIGLFELDWPAGQVDIAKLSELFKNNDLNTLCASAAPRSKQELLDMYDLTTRLHAMCVRAGVKELKDTEIDPDVVYERHYALNWLLNIGEFTSWDSIIPTT